MYCNYGAFFFTGTVCSAQFRNCVAHFGDRENACPISKLRKVTAQSRNCTRASRSQSPLIHVASIHVASAAPRYFFAKLSTAEGHAVLAARVREGRGTYTIYMYDTYNQD